MNSRPCPECSVVQSTSHNGACARSCGKNSQECDVKSGTCPWTQSSARGGSKVTVFTAAFQNNTERSLEEHSRERKRQTKGGGFRRKQSCPVPHASFPLETLCQLCYPGNSWLWDWSSGRTNPRHTLSQTRKALKWPRWIEAQSKNNGKRTRYKSREHNGHANS